MENCHYSCHAGTDLLNLFSAVSQKVPGALSIAACSRSRNLCSSLHSFALIAVWCPARGNTEDFLSMCQGFVRSRISAGAAFGSYGFPKGGSPPCCCGQQGSESIGNNNRRNCIRRSLGNHAWSMNETMTAHRHVQQTTPCC